MKMRNTHRRAFGSLFSQATAALPAATTSAPPAGSIAAQIAAAAPPPSTAPAPAEAIIDQGAVGVVPAATSSIASQVAAYTAIEEPTSAQITAAANLGIDEAAIALMHANVDRSTNATPYLAVGVIDQGAVGAPPSYIALPAYDPSLNPGGVDFPYSTPPPKWEPNLKWWTGQTLLNVGVPQYSNDPWEYLRYALVGSYMTMVRNWIEWYMAALGKPATTPYASSQPWAQALQNLDLSQHKYIQTSEGPVFLPFSYSDLTNLQQMSAAFEYGYDANTLSNMLAQWVSQVLPDVSQYPLSSRLNPSTTGVSPYVTNNLPAIYRQGSTFLSQAMPYIPVLTIALGGALALVLAAGSGVGALASDVAEESGSVSVDVSGEVAGDIGAYTATDALTTGADAALAAGSDLADPLAEITVSALAPTTSLAAGITTGLTMAAAAGATMSAPLEEVNVTAQAPDNAPPIESDVAGGIDIAADLATTSIPQVNYPTDSTHIPSPPGASTILSALAKLFGGGATHPTGNSSDAATGVTGDSSESVGDWLGNLTSTDWLLILAAGAGGLYFIHESRPRRKVA